MSTPHAAPMPAESPHAQLVHMATAYWISRAVYTAAKLGLADHLAAAPRTADEVAAVTGSHALSLYRLMRALAGLGVLTECPERRFGLTPLGAALQRDAPGAGRSTVLALAGHWWWHGWEHLPHCVETGETGMHRAFDTTVFDYLAAHPEEATHFNEAMIGFHGAEPTAVAEAYDFSDCHTVVDVGGGTGNLLAAILERYTSVQGVLGERSHVIAEARSRLATRDVGARVVCEAIDFFASVPAGGDVYLLSHVIHDWPEEDCLTILRHCRRALTPAGRLLIVEMVLKGANAPDPGVMLDLAMLVMPGGQERTEDEYAALLAKAGFELRRVVPTRSAVSVVEARAVA